MKKFRLNCIFLLAHLLRPKLLLAAKLSIYNFSSTCLLCGNRLNETCTNTLNLYQNKYLFSQMSFILQLEYKRDLLSP